MNREARLVGWLAVLLAPTLAVLLLAWPLRARQTNLDNSAPPETFPAAPPSPEETSSAASGAAPVEPPSAPLASENSPRASREAGEVAHTFSLGETYSVTVSPDWSANSGSEIPPPAPLGPYAPFHLSGNLVLSNMPRGAILQFATSNNPFVGHDSYWLDAQMHAPGGSGMSLFDFFFYYFFPPSNACLHQVLTTYAPASRVSPTENMQVYYSCPLSDTLSDFYAAQVSAGITFELTDNGTRVLAPVGDFYVAPMEQVEESGMTFFVFEAQGMNAVSSDAARRFHLPENAQDGQPDFFWAIGAPSPFPFVADATRTEAILQVAYARLGVGPDSKSDFMDILHAIRAH